MLNSLPQSVRACAAALVLAAGAAHAQQPAQRVHVKLPAYRQAIAIDTIMFVTDHEVSAGVLWAAAAKVFYDYKIATDLRDSAGGVVGTTKYVKSSYLINFPMSKVLNCGTSITGPNADNFRISLALVAIVSQTAQSKSKLGVGFVGSGLDMRGSSSDPVVCASTGQFEGDFADRVRKILKGAP
jgi:hypothetical protein